MGRQGQERAGTARAKALADRDWRQAERPFELEGESPRQRDQEKMRGDERAGDR